MEAATSQTQEQAETLQVVVEKPPIWDKAHKLFTINDAQTVYTYGHKLYNPANIDIDEFLFEHEKEHEAQQMDYPGGPEAWWDRYFKDQAFREDQEFEGYHAQYWLYCTKTNSRDKRFRYRWQLAGQFCAMKGVALGRTEVCNFLKHDIHP